MNEFQKETLKEIQSLLPGAHYINLEIRTGGKFLSFEADFLKEILLPIKENKIKCDNCNGKNTDYYGEGYPCDQCDVNGMKSMENINENNQ